MEKTVEALRVAPSLDTPGLFRISADANVLGCVSDLFDEGADVRLWPSEPHLNANLLKKFLRDMRDPLLTFELYSLFVATSDSRKFGEAYAPKLRGVFKHLPSQNCEL
eukprot:CAMPEP_0201485322 /NCGR_PEP_ID=MMETSP0151_2-20130828/9439_1 /ASSEMBLY_ACC=CAM_ASM_000257 /TAXON_ID=200890 /ORGANISM="Paramoeba atlantica, Strain 621/1 / CCAP 1560/9" /LENGTH=107 /DNA_ID=CAMNT_0047869407 /DNA_START=474 /DNA_END=794 /DNA_ORIENTATION=-